MKTVERAHRPASLWHRVALDRNYAKALKQVDGLLSHWCVYLFPFIIRNILPLILHPVLYAAFLAQAAFPRAQEQATAYENHPVFHENTKAVT